MVTSLGICIPTYRRPDFLRSCVNSVISSAEGRPVRVFVVDDSASDINSQVLLELSDAYADIFVIKNDENIGIDANIQKAVDVCDCDYAWLIGEDDVFLPGAVALMYDFLQSSSAPFVFSAYQYVSEDHSKVLGVVSGGESTSLMQTERFVSEMLWSIGFIGAVVVRCRAWKETESYPYLGTYFTHVGRILDLLGTVSNVPLRNVPGVANRAQGVDTFTWKKDAFGVFLGFERMCETAAQRNPSLVDCLKKARLRYREKFAYFSVKTTFRLRSEGAFDYRQYRDYISGLTSLQKWRKVWLLMLALLPSALLKPFAQVYISLTMKR